MENHLYDAVLHPHPTPIHAYGEHPDDVLDNHDPIDRYLILPEGHDGGKSPPYPVVN